MFQVKEASWKVILVYLLVSLSLAALINLVLFPSPFFSPISNLTGNLINGTLQANLLNILMFSVLIFGWAKLRPSGEFVPRDRRPCPGEPAHPDHRVRLSRTGDSVPADLIFARVFTLEGTEKPPETFRPLLGQVTALKRTNVVPVSCR